MFGGKPNILNSKKLKTFKDLTPEQQKEELDIYNGKISRVASKNVTTFDLDAYMITKYKNIQTCNFDLGSSPFLSGHMVPRK